MTAGLPEGIERAPQPVRRLAGGLASRRMFLVSVPTKNPRPGDRLYLARTPVGQVRVWSNRGAWAVELAPPGMTEFVDAGVWRACQEGTELGVGRPSIAEQVAWLEGLLEGRSLPAHDAACLAERARERKTQPFALTGARLWIFLAFAVPILVAASWASVANDLPAVRVMVSITVAGILVALLRPWAARYQVRRQRSK